MRDDLDDMSGVPRYVQVARILEREIRAGNWEQGRPILSRVQLTQRFGIAQATAGRAHDWLNERGYIVAVPGVGMVVTSRDRWPDSDSGSGSGSHTRDGATGSGGTSGTRSSTDSGTGS